VGESGAEGEAGEEAGGGEGAAVRLQDWQDVHAGFCRPQNS